ncbi:hypothetical protein Hanom_Chr12g01108831 [Helianthus anomalus]
MIKFDFFEIWTKMAKKCKPQGPRFKKFGIWTKVTKVIKPQGPFWLLTHSFIFLYLWKLSEILFQASQTCVTFCPFTNCHYSMKTITISSMV